jgi:ubiquinone biosynthesis protein
MADRLLDRSKAVWHALEVMPGHVSRTLEKLSKDELQIQLELKGLNHFTLEIERSSNRLAVGLVMSALIVASALLMRQGTQSVWLTLPLFLASSLLGIWLIYGIFRSGRL